jgi:hypothetical protein
MRHQALKEQQLRVQLIQLVQGSDSKELDDFFKECAKKQINVEFLVNSTFIGNETLLAYSTRVCNITGGQKEKQAIVGCLLLAGAIPVFNGEAIMPREYLNRCGFSTVSDHRKYPELHRKLEVLEKKDEYLNQLRCYNELNHDKTVGMPGPADDGAQREREERETELLCQQVAAPQSVEEQRHKARRGAGSHDPRPTTASQSRQSSVQGNPPHPAPSAPLPEPSAPQPDDGLPPQYDPSMEAVRGQYVQPQAQHGGDSRGGKS